MGKEEEQTFFEGLVDFYSSARQVLQAYIVLRAAQSLWVILEMSLIGSEIFRMFRVFKIRIVRGCHLPQLNASFYQFHCR